MHTLRSRNVLLTRAMSTAVKKRIVKPLIWSVAYCTMYTVVQCGNLDTEKEDYYRLRKI